MNVLLAAVLLPPVAYAALNPFDFNQFWLQKLEMRHGVMSCGVFADFLRSSYAGGLDLLRRWPARQAPPFEDSEALFAHVFAWIPPHAVVYPTEGFYYFETRVGDDTVRGNVRVADLDKGLLSFAYFTVKEDSKDPKTVMRDFRVEDGLGIDKRSEHDYRVSYRGKTVAFKIPTTAETPPRRLGLLPEEHFVGQIHDESGIRFFLLYNRATHSFYEVLNEENGVADDLEPVGESCLVGKRTGFVFYEDGRHDRKLFLGLSLANGFANNYYDGPGDQVPFRADLAGMLHEAYPSTLLGDGVDAHGVWRNRDAWCRFVVGPFHSYGMVDELRERVRKCLAGAGDPDLPPGEFWTALTKEWWYTRDWMRDIASSLQAEGKRMPLEDPWRQLRFHGERPWEAGSQVGRLSQDASGS